MFGLYTPVLILQAYCVYHAYRNNAEQRWYWLILLFPLIGSIIYLAQNFNSPGTLASVKENVKAAVISNYRIEQLEKALRFSDNIRNKANLADAYTEIGRYQDAIGLYTSCLQGFMAEDPPLRLKLLQCHFLNEGYAQAIELGQGLESEKSFRDSPERVSYAWALHNAGKNEAAEKVFTDMDRSLTNYYHRMEYCKFLLKNQRADEAKQKLETLVAEFEFMKSTERKINRDTIREIKDLYTSHVRA